MTIQTILSIAIIIIAILAFIGYAIYKIKNRRYKIGKTDCNCVGKNTKRRYWQIHINTT